jgi:hypothetical protein
LGSLYSGLCQSGGAAVQPDEETLKDKCNMGYAAGCCARFRPGAGDAVRFAIASCKDGGLSVRWLVESGGLPVLSGEVSCAEVDSGEPFEDAPGFVESQVRAYLASYREAVRVIGDPPVS